MLVSSFNSIMRLISFAKNGPIQRSIVSVQEWPHLIVYSNIPGSIVTP